MNEQSWTVIPATSKTTTTTLTTRTKTTQRSNNRDDITNKLKQSIHNKRYENFALDLFWLPENVISHPHIGSDRCSESNHSVSYGRIHSSCPVSNELLSVCVCWSWCWCCHSCWFIPAIVSIASCCCWCSCLMLLSLPLILSFCFTNSFVLLSCCFREP